MALLTLTSPFACLRGSTASSRLRFLTPRASLYTAQKRSPARRTAIAVVPSNGATATPEKASPASAQDLDKQGRINWRGVHHVALLVENLERSLHFYQGILGLELNPDRPHHKLPYRGAWLWIGPEMIHLMELPNPDTLEDRPEHGGRDRHFCVGVERIAPIVEHLRQHEIPYTMSMSGRPAVFFRDPDMNCLEIVETKPWR